MSKLKPSFKSQILLYAALISLPGVAAAQVGYKVNGVVVLRNGTEIPFDRVGTYGDLSGDTLYLTGPGAEIESVPPPRVNVSYKDLKAIIIGDITTKRKQASQGSGSVDCRWLTLKTTFKDGSKEDIWLNLTHDSVGLTECGPYLQFNLAKGRATRAIDFEAIKEIRFEIPQNPGS